MLSLMKRLKDDESGNALMIAGAALPILIGSAGLATDTVQWFLWKRQLQRAADSAAIASVHGKLKGETVANAVARSLVLHNSLGSTPIIGYLTPAAPYATDVNAVRLSLSYSQRLNFSSFFMSAVPTISAHATATVVRSGKYCVVSLEDQAVTGISATGAASVDLGCGMITNSTSMNATVATGQATVSASPIAAVGGIPASARWGSGTVLQPFTLPQDDPFGHVNASVPSGSCPSVQVEPNGSTIGGDGKVTVVNGVTTMTPGCYSNITLKGRVDLNPGTYVLNAGSMTLTSGADIRCNGCTIVFTNSNTASNASIGTLVMDGQAKLDLVAPSGTSDPYKGIIFYQDRRATADNPVTIVGNSFSKLEGALYFPRALLTFSGSSGVDSACLQIVGKRILITGNVAITNSCPFGSGSSAFDGRRVRVVA